MAEELGLKSMVPLRKNVEHAERSAILRTGNTVYYTLAVSIVAHYFKTERTGDESISAKRERFEMKELLADTPWDTSDVHAYERFFDDSHVMSNQTVARTVQ